MEWMEGLREEQQSSTNGWSCDLGSANHPVSFAYRIVSHTLTPLKVQPSNQLQYIIKTKKRSVRSTNLPDFLFFWSRGQKILTTKNISFSTPPPRQSGSNLQLFAVKTISFHVPIPEIHLPRNAPQSLYHHTPGFARRRDNFQPSNHCAQMSRHGQGNGGADRQERPLPIRWPFQRAEGV